jgi:hypothetical protein
VRGAQPPPPPAPRLRAVRAAPAPSLGQALRQRIALLSVDAVGFLTGTMIGLFWYPAAALLAMLAAALVSRFARR